MRYESIAVNRIGDLQRQVEVAMLQKLFPIIITTALTITPAVAANVQKEPPGSPFQKVSTLVKLPDFVPGLGTLYVDPKTLPEGPFLAYDHKGRLVSTIYMVLLKDMNAQKNFGDLPAPGGTVDHVSVSFNAGHPGVPDPHYHIVLWHVPRSGEEAVAK